jgi:hypothetical protein
VIRSLRSLANKLQILARQADIFGINQFTSWCHINIVLVGFIGRGNLSTCLTCRKSLTNFIT